MADGQVLIDSKLNTSGVEKGVKSLEKGFSGLAQVTKRTADVMRRELNDIDVEGLADGMSDSFEDESREIQQTFAENAQEAQQTADRISDAYESAADEQAESMRKAWDRAESASATGSRRVIGDLDDIEDKAKRSGKEIEGSFSKAFSGLAAKIAGGLGAIFAADTIFDFGKESIQLGSDLAEVQNVVDVTFGESAAVIDDFAKTAIKQFGLSETSAKKFSSTLGAMLKSMGNFSDDQIVEMSTALSGLAGDMASFYNLDAQEAFDKLRSGISGETEPLKQLGINLSVANLEAFALAEGIDKSYEKMTEHEKALLRYNYILSVTADAQGDFARTQDSWANQTRILEESFNSLKATIGQGLINVLNPIITKINAEFIPSLQSIADKFKEVTTGIDLTDLDIASVFGDVNVEPAIKAFKAFGQAAAKLGSTVSSGLSYVWETVLVPLGEWTIEEGVPAVVDGLASAFNFLSSTLEYLAPLGTTFVEEFLIPIGDLAGTVAVGALDLLSAGFDNLSKSAAESSQTAAEAIVQNYTAAASMTEQGFVVPTHEQMLALRNNIVEWFSGAADNIVNDFTTASNTLDSGFVIPTSEDMQALGSLISEAFETAANTLMDTWRSVSGWFEANVVTPIAQAFKNMKASAIQAWNDIASEITDIWEKIKQTVKGALDSIQNWINNLTGKEINIGVTKVDRGGGNAGTPDGVSAYEPASYAVTPQIPYLATGAVIPPNAPFMAVLGDQRNGTNIEAPLDTIKQAVSDVLAEAGMNVDVNINFLGELAQLARIMYPEIEVERRRKGSSLAEVTL